MSVYSSAAELDADASGPFLSEPRGMVVPMDYSRVTQVWGWFNRHTDF